MRLSLLLLQTKAQILERKQTLRVVSLAFLYLAMFGPWAYDRINVPAEFSCNFPIVRLEGDYCGVPLSGISILFMVLEGLSSISRQYLAGSAVFPNRARELLFMISFFLFPLPFFSTMFVLFKRNSNFSPGNVGTGNRPGIVLVCDSFLSLSTSTDMAFVGLLVLPGSGNRDVGFGSACTEDEK